MTHKQKIQYAIFAVEQVLPIFEEKCPNDKRPRQAIEATKLVLKKNNQENRQAAYAYAYAAHAYADANAANAVAYAANAVAYAAVWNKMQIKILKNGLKIIYKEK